MLGILSLGLSGVAAMPAVANDAADATHKLLGRAEQEYRLDMGRGFLLGKQGKGLGEAAPAAAPQASGAAARVPPVPDAAKTAARVGQPAPHAAREASPPAMVLKAGPATNDMERRLPTIDAALSASPPAVGKGESEPAAEGRSTLAPADDGYAGITPSPVPEVPPADAAPVRIVPQVTAPAPAPGDKGEAKASPRATAPETPKATEAKPPAPRITESKLSPAQCRELLTRAQIGDVSKSEIQLLRSSCH